MLFSEQLQVSGLAVALVTLWFTGAAVLPVVQGQYETPNHLCGGHFRFFTGSINFTHTNLTTPTNGTIKVCIWQIIPSPTYPSLRISYSGNTLNNTEHLAITGFSENSTELYTRTLAKSAENFTAMGDLLVVTLVANKTTGLGGGFQLRWDRTSPDDMRKINRFVVVSNFYGLQASRPPYYASAFMGNSLSTFAFPKGNETDNYTMKIDTWSLDLSGDGNDTTCPHYGPVGDTYFCNTFIVTRIQPDATLQYVTHYNNVTAEDMIWQNQLGFFMVMWGGNRFNATGGGRWTYEFTHIRN